MVFVPDAFPHFVLICLENIGWSVRDYSSGQARLMPPVALGRPIDQIIDGPREHGSFRVAAPRVPITDFHFGNASQMNWAGSFSGHPRPLTIRPGIATLCSLKRNSGMPPLI
jgi:hypothetical protein